MAEASIYCVVCLKSHAPPVAVAVMDRCPSQPDLMAALERSLAVTAPAAPVEPGGV